MRVIKIVEDLLTFAAKSLDPLIITCITEGLMCYISIKVYNCTFNGLESYKLMIIHFFHFVTQRLILLMVYNCKYMIY